LIKKTFFLILTLVFCFISRPVFAEPYIAIYAGGALHQDVKVKDTSPSNRSFNKADVDDSFVLGGKIGYWAEFLPYFGIEAEVFYLTADMPRQDVSKEGSAKIIDQSIDIIDVGFNGLVRYPIERQNFRIEPYGGLGVGIFYAESEDRTSLSSDSDDTSAAFHVLSGTRIRLTKNIFAFVEYKYIQATSEFHEQQIEFEDFKIHNIYGGIEFRFGGPK